MVKTELIQRVAKGTGVSKATVSKILEAILSEIVSAIVTDGTAVIRGFGTFSLRTARSKTGRNFISGELVEVPERKIPAFTPSDSLKKYVEESVK